MRQSRDWKLRLDPLISRGASEAAAHPDVPTAARVALRIFSQERVPLEMVVGPAVLAAHDTVKAAGIGTVGGPLQIWSLGP